MKLHKCLFIAVIFLAIAIAADGQRNYAANSVLSTGNWFKIGVKQEGIYKIDIPFLNSLGINTANLPSA